MKKRLLTGDRPTGPLHLGHYIGSLKNRILLQDKYECFFIIADLQVFTDHLHEYKKIKNNIVELLLDYLAIGLKPENYFFVQSEVPELAELTIYFSYLVSLAYLKRNPTIKKESEMYHVKNMSLGFFGYPVSQAADILIFKPQLVPVGKDQLPHIELAREITKKFNQTFKKEVFILPEALLSECPSLIGIDGKNKMSKSLDNAIFLKDSEEELREKVFRMYTDPKRIHANIPGETENNPVFIYHRIFNSNLDEVKYLEEKYKRGDIGDKEVKEKLFHALNSFLKPIRDKREKLSNDLNYLERLLKEGNKKAKEVAVQTLLEVKKAMKIYYGD